MMRSGDVCLVSLCSDCNRESRLALIRQTMGRGHAQSDSTRTVCVLLDDKATNTTICSRQHDTGYETRNF